MSDPHDAPEPMDRAYAEAEALLNDAQERAARRARVLAAVAAEPAAAPVVETQGVRRSAWRRGGWLAAAGVAGLSVLVATQVRLPSLQRSPPAPAAAAAAVVAAPAGAGDAAAPTPVAKAARPEQRRAETPAVAAQAKASGSREARVAGPAPPPMAQVPTAPTPAEPSSSEVNELVVTGARIEPPPAAEARARASGLSADAAADPAVEARRVPKAASPEVTAAGALSRPESVGAPGERTARLRAAAAAGRIREVTALLAGGVPVDAVDAAGETALMKAIQADQPAVAALLRRRGASLERENQAGVSAREMARRLGGAEMERALGLEP